MYDTYNMIQPLGSGSVQICLGAIMEALTTLQRVLMSVYLIITCFIIHLLGCILSRLVVPNETNYETV